MRIMWFMTFSFLSWLPGSSKPHFMFITVTTVASVVSIFASSFCSWLWLYYYSFKNGKMPGILTEILPSLPHTFSSHMHILSCSWRPLSPDSALLMALKWVPFSGTVLACLKFRSRKWDCFTRSPSIRPLIGGFKMISKPSSFLTFRMRHKFVNIHRQISFSESLRRESRKITENMLNSDRQRSINLTFKTNSFSFADELI